MSLNAQSLQYLAGLPFVRKIDVSTGPTGPNGVTAAWLIPTSGWVGDQRFPYDVSEDLNGQSYDKETVDGIEYYLVPEDDSSNLPGKLSEYAQRTGVAELQNPPGGGVNRVAEGLENADATVDPDGVAKYADENDNWEDARKEQNEQDARVERQVSISPAREPSDGKLVEVSNDDKSASVKPATSSPKKAADSK